jgi:ADP-ribose pyrophosphatase
MWKVLESRVEFQGWRIRVRTDRILNPDGKEATRDVVEHPGAVTVVALPQPDEVVLVRQYRHATGEELLELPAGTREEGEDPIVTAGRELEEETGYRAGKIRPLTSFYTAPGFTDELMYLFEATELTLSEQRLDEDEFIDVVPVSRDDALAMIEDGRIKDAKTIVGLLMVFK